MAPKVRSGKPNSPTRALTAEEKELVKKYERITGLVGCATAGATPEQLRDFAKEHAMSGDEVATAAQHLKDVAARLAKASELLGVKQELGEDEDEE